MIRWAVIAACVLALGGCGSAPAPRAHGPVGLDPLLLGNETEGSIGEGISDEIVAIRFTAVHTGKVEKLEVHTSTTAPTATSVILGIYSDSTEKVGTLLGEATSGAPGTNAWVSATLATSVNVTSGTAYWLAYNPRPNTNTLSVLLETGAFKEETLSGNFSKMEPFTGASTHTFREAIRGMGTEGESEGGGAAGQVVMMP